jgi:diguanylate cyclase (GGDEF)-like protein
MRRNYGKSERKSAQLADRRLEKITDTVSDLYQKAVQNEQIMRRYQQFELSLLDQSSLEELLDMLLRNTLDYFQLDFVELWLYDPHQTLAELLPENYCQQTGLKLLDNTNPIEQLYGKQASVRLVSSKVVENMSVFVDRNVQSAALLPLVRGGVMVGSLHFGVLGKKRYSNDKSTDFIAHLAKVISVCLENAVNQERLSRLGMYDMLTKVKNRRAFHLALDKEVSRAIRSSAPLSLLFVDLDYFKQVNDTYGHPMGDKVLTLVAQHINEMLRKTDHVCRYGGEEFALVLPNCSQQRAMDISERIRQQISSLDIENDAAEEDGLRKISITLSIGVCCWLPQAESEQGFEEDIARELVASSDRGVYLSKAAGRNCVNFVPLTDIGNLEDAIE